MGMVLSAVGACLLFILKAVGILLLILLVLAALLLPVTALHAATATDPIRQPPISANAPKTPPSRIAVPHIQH